MKTSQLVVLSVVAACSQPVGDDPLEPEDGSSTLGRRDAGVSDAGATSSSKPNILLVIADDFGIEVSPCYTLGTTNQRPAMPTLEAMCASGIVFDNFWAKPECSPTRSSLMTGLYGFRTNVGSAGDILSSSTKTLQQALAPKYSNAVVGKWHLSGATVKLSETTALGVGYFQGVWIGALTNYYNWNQTLSDGGSKTQTTYATTVISDDAINWLAGASQPWFMWLAYTAPHSPFHLPPAGLHTSNTTLSGTTMDTFANPLPYYIAALEALDHELKRVLDSLPTDVRANTLIVFMGDNGTPEQVAQAPTTSTTSKATLYEGGIHTPLVISGAGVTRTGVRESALVQMEDLMATLAQQGGATPSGIDGVSFSSLLTGTTGGRAVQYSEFFRGSGMARMDSPENFGWTTRDSRYQLIYKTQGPVRELYDVSVDPGGTLNLLADGGSSANQTIAAGLEDAGHRLRGE